MEQHEENSALLLVSVSEQRWRVLVWHHRALVWLGGLTGRPPEGKERCGILHCILASVAAPREKSDFSHFSLAGLLEHAAANALLEQ